MNNEKPKIIDESRGLHTWSNILAIIQKASRDYVRGTSEKHNFLELSLLGLGRATSLLFSMAGINNHGSTESYRLQFPM